ncbi:P-loop NTPase family protein [Alicyclobacillus vulcanalis]|uniref:MinD-like ATPase involved in chromosome partitioning or flagellar assembly n=1 Tax=Alicyclobacillus vulcanalis TaxID=252246 RepID=A0A1N7PJV3_9BACL|nr:hypothetical protein [Alicyclobacillus vulcanalis]SIT10760.1 hypothetical protein SAMN05421799_11415 [Alicyclobacillus vulcanalis]
MIAVRLRESLQRELTGRVEIAEDWHALEGRKVDALLLDAKRVPETELYEIRERFSETPITYIVDEFTSALTAFAAAHNIRLVHASRVLSYLDEAIGQGQSTPILAFWGVYPRLGTTTIALAVAHVLAAQHGKSVGVLGLNAYDPGTAMVPGAEHHLDDILSYLAQQKLDPETLQAAMEPVLRVKYLPGLQNQTRALAVMPEHVRHLLHVARSQFEVLVLDVGSALNTALALEGLQAATHRYVIANDLVATQRQLLRQMDYILRPLGVEPRDLMLIGSQVHGKGGLAKAVGMMQLAAIPYYPSIDLFAEQSPEPMKVFLAEKTFRKAVETLAQSAVTLPATPEVAASVRA